MISLEKMDDRHTDRLSFIRTCLHSGLVLKHNNMMQIWWLKETKYKIFTNGFSAGFIEDEAYVIRARITPVTNAVGNEHGL